MTSLFRLLMFTTLAYASVVTELTQAQTTQYELKSLKPNQQGIVFQPNGFASVTMIFQPDCSWCKKQGKVMADAYEQCHASMKVNLVGTRGNARQLRKELKHYHREIPAYLADRGFLRKIGGYQASPTTLFFDQKGELVAKQRGYVSPDKLASAFSILTNGGCQI